MLLAKCNYSSSTFFGRYFFKSAQVGQKMILRISGLAFRARMPFSRHFQVRELDKHTLLSTSIVADVLRYVNKKEGVTMTPSSVGNRGALSFLTREDYITFAGSSAVLNAFLICLIACLILCSFSTSASRT